MRPYSSLARRSGWRRGVSCRSPLAIEMAVIDDAVFARSRDHRTQYRDALAACGKHLSHLLERIRLDDCNHADAAVEGAQQLRLGDVTLLGQPFEHWQHWQSRKVDADAKMRWQHARNIVGEAAAGDMCKSLHRGGLSDRAQAGLYIKPCRRQQRAAERHHGRERRRRVEWQTALRDDL